MGLNRIDYSVDSDFYWVLRTIKGLARRRDWNDNKHGTEFRNDDEVPELGKEISMKGVQFLVDENGKKTAVLIDLKRNAELWEDFYDLALARARTSEPRESIETVKRRLRAAKPTANG
jgi:hypothetical protein